MTIGAVDGAVDGEAVVNVGVLVGLPAGGFAEDCAEDCAAVVWGGVEPEGAATTTLPLGRAAPAALLVTVLTTVTVCLVVEPELQPAARTVRASRGRSKVRRMTPTVGRHTVNVRSTRRNALTLLRYCNKWCPQQRGESGPRACDPRLRIKISDHDMQALQATRTLVRNDFDGGWNYPPHPPTTTRPT